MPEPIRVLHFADVHIGMENFGRMSADTGLSERISDFLHRMDEMIEFALANDVDVAIFAGDAFKNNKPDPTLQEQFAHRIRDLSAHVPVVLLEGNHDQHPHERKASSMSIYHALGVPNVWVADAPDVQRIETKRGALWVAAMPYPMRSRFMAQLSTSGLGLAEIDQQLRALVMQRLHELSEEIAQHATPDEPRLLAGHFSVDNATTGSEKGLMLGRDLSIPLSALTHAGWDYVALGHIHKHQNCSARQDGATPVVYSGSLERVDFGEAIEDKGFCWVEAQRGQTAWRFIPVAARPMLTLPERADAFKHNPDVVRELLGSIRKLDLQGVILRVRLELAPEADAQFNERDLRKALLERGAFHVTIERDVERVTRSRLGGNPEGLSHSELLERYFISRDVPSERRAELLALAQGMLQASEEER